MKKKLLFRGAVGIPVGLSIGYLITIFISLARADGAYFACMPELLLLAGSESRAVALQALLYGLLGFGFGALSVIWELERWSLARQTAVYLLGSCAIMFPCAYIAHWMEHTLLGFLFYCAIFLFIFLVIWGTQLLGMQYNVRKINHKLQQKSTPGNNP